MPLLGIRIGIPSLLLGPEFSLFKRVWVGTRTDKGLFVPKIKMLGLGFDDLQQQIGGEGKELCFRSFEEIPIASVAAKEKCSDTVMVEWVRSKVEAAGLSEEEIVEALDPDREYGKTSHLSGLDMKF